MKRAKTLRTTADLARALLISEVDRAALDAVAARYAVAVTPALADMIERDDIHDPLASQFVPTASELLTAPEENVDPIGDDAHSPLPGLVHRYPDRVLLKLVHVCPVYCRYCFRREMVGPHGRGTMSGREISAALDYIRRTPAIWEVILTGGEPLLMSPRRLRRVMQELGQIDHVKILRVHTRLPAVQPERISAELIRALKSSGKATYLVLHANHARELTPAVRSACAAIVDAGIPMLSQSVLLRNVNDDPDTLEALFRALVECRIKPYYLHHADLAPGTAHFRTSIATGQAAMRALRGRLSGIAQPTYVLDIPGGHGKSPIGPNYLSRDEAGQMHVSDYNGGSHCYPPPK